jgi:type I restriction enzyme R subunit
MSPANYMEQDFEEHIEQHLVASGYQSVHYVKYNRKLCLLPEELVDFIKETQPNEYEQLQRQYGELTDQKISERIAGVIQKNGVLEALRKGVKDRGVHLRLSPNNLPYPNF